MTGAQSLAVTAEKRPTTGPPVYLPTQVGFTLGVILVSARSEMVLQETGPLTSVNTSILNRPCSCWVGLWSCCLHRHVMTINLAE